MEFNYRIRKGTIDDADALAEIEAICFPAAEAAGKEALAFRLQTFPECFFVAEADGRCIGFINGCATNERVIADEMYEKAECHIPDGAYQSIFGLDTLPEYRCHGVAAALMNRLIDDARAKGRKGLILTCKDHLIPYYSKFGYQHMGVSSSVHGGAVWNDMILEF
ncbi:MAG: GNAT family N-acetyltransferase [Coprococcus sp.]